MNAMSQIVAASPVQVETKPRKRVLRAIGITFSAIMILPTVIALGIVMGGF